MMQGRQGFFSTQKILENKKSRKTALAAAFRPVWQRRSVTGGV